MSSTYLVKTVSGKEVPRNKTRYISKEYHEINEDCFFMSEDTGRTIREDWKNQDGRWHRKGNGQIEFDHEDKDYVLLNKVPLSHGIVGIDDKSKVIMGYMSTNKAKNVIFDGNNCISYEIPEKLGALEEYSSGSFYSSNKTSKTTAQLQKKGIRTGYTHTRINYSASNNMEEFVEAYNKYYKPANNVNCSVAKELGETSFGIEFESDNGRIREDLLYRNGLIPLRDGSLRHDGIEPYEYTTIPLKGEKGLQTIVDQVALLNKYTTISHRCALHVHIGGVTPTEEFIVGNHRLMIRLQDEIYSLFPSNYRHTSQNGFKQKDYCAPIKNIKLRKDNSVKENFLMLFSHYCDGRDRFDGFNVRNHPADRDNRSKWHVESRYYIQNIINMMWGSAKTIEWRIHPPTQHIDKIINWLFIITGITKYAEKHQEELANWCELRNVNLECIMNEIYSPVVAAKLNNYIEWRKQYMEKMDGIGTRELEEDLMELPKEMCVLC